MYGKKFQRTLMRNGRFGLLNYFTLRRRYINQCMYNHDLWLKYYTAAEELEELTIYRDGFNEQFNYYLDKSHYYAHQEFISCLKLWQLKRLHFGINEHMNLILPSASFLNTRIDGIMYHSLSIGSVYHPLYKAEKPKKIQLYEDCLH